MKPYKYLIIGGGMAADAAVQGIRSVDPSGEIGLISAERYPSDNRPPLSKGLWKGEPVDAIWRKTNDQNATVHLGCTASVLHLGEKRVADTGGNSYSWERPQAFDKLMDVPKQRLRHPGESTRSFQKLLPSQ